MRFRNYNLEDKEFRTGVHLKNLAAMTEENLHSKAEIAMELTHRDLQIEQLQQELKELKEKCRWIPVEEALPDTDKSLFIFMQDGLFGDFYYGYFDSRRFYTSKDDALSSKCVTHWRYIDTPEEL